MEKKPYNWLERALWPAKEQTWEHVLVSRLSEAALRGARVLVEPGCGQSSPPITEAGLQGLFRVGLDPDPSGVSNPDISAFVVGDACRAPLASESADVILCRYVLEHVAEPEAAVEEFRRLLRPGGHVIVSLPNIFNPAMLAAKLTPTRFHVRVRGLSVDHQLAENCPTYYRANTPGRLRELFERAGFRTEFIFCADQAFSYLKFSRILMPFALLYGRLTDPRALRWLKSAIVAEFVKP